MFCRLFLGSATSFPVKSGVLDILRSAHRLEDFKALDLKDIQWTKEGGFCSNNECSDAESISHLVRFDYGLPKAKTRRED